MPQIAAQAAELGIETEYLDARGFRREVPENTLEKLLEVLAPAATSAQTMREAVVVRPGRACALDSIPDHSWRLLSTDGTEVARGEAGAPIQIPEETPLGTYQLAFLKSRQRRPTPNLTRTVIVAPDRAFQLEGLATERVWVLAVQLYAVRSHRNWGHGDFTDLKNLLQLCGAIGASGIGLNPLHALFDDRPEQASPYAPNSRLFLNTLYIDLDAVPEFTGAEALGLTAQIDRVRQSELVDYAAVGAAKVKALRAAYDVFRTKADPGRRAAFQQFRQARGESLDRFAAFEVLRRRYQAVWWEWPKSWRQPTSKKIAALCQEEAKEVDYYCYVQWVADRQLADCQEEARRLGLPIGLYIDLAVGVEPGGADAWAAQTSIIPQVEVGAPPDLLNTAGQAWGLAAFNPRALEAEAFAPFMRMIEAAMRYAGAIRLDHVLGLNRLYLIPFGRKPDEGAYIRYPLQALLAVVALQSARHRCLVIGEDLGTVPEELRGILADWGIWSYLVLLFERTGDGSFKAPDEYRRNALVTFSTHDLPTFEGWSSGHDLRVKRDLGFDPGESDDERGKAHWLMGEALARSRVSEDRQWEFADIVRFLARTPSRLLVIEIDDALRLRDQPNVPGTVDEHPNWRRRLPVALEDLEAEQHLREIARALTEEGRDFTAG
jgi:4-alpha-glucanotransferase